VVGLQPVVMVAKSTKENHWRQYSQCLKSFYYKMQGKFKLTEKDSYYDEIHEDLAKGTSG